MKLEWIILAEGLGQDAKSAITAIGIGQNVLIAPTLPAVTKRAILAHFVIDKTDDDTEPLKEGDKLLFRVSFVSPSGKVIQAISAPATLAPMPWPDLPASIDMPAEMLLTCPEYGRYEIIIEADLPDGKTINGHLDFYVREAPPPPPS
jgi:hypothetical protein